MTRCECVCETCLSGDHCDSATCALPTQPKFHVGQRVGVVGSNVLGSLSTSFHGAYGHVVTVQPRHPEVELPQNVYDVELIGGFPMAFDNPETMRLINPVPLWESELEAVD